MIIRASPIATNKTKDDWYRWIDFQHSQGQILPALHLPDIQDRGAYNCVRLFSKMIRSRSSAIIRIQLVQSSEFRPITWISLISLKPPGIPSSFEGGYKMITPAQFMPALQFQSSRGAAESKTAQPEVAGWLEHEEEGRGCVHRRPLSFAQPNAMNGARRTIKTKQRNSGREGGG